MTYEQLLTNFHTIMSQVDAMDMDPAHRFAIREMFTRSYADLIRDVAKVTY
jgi:hypothetical protein